MAQPRLSPNEMHALMQAAAPTSGRTAEAAAGGGGRRRGGGRRKGRSTSARPRLSRRERRAVNDALLHMSSPDARHMDAKAVFDLRHRQPVAWTVLREHKSHSVPTSTSATAAGGGAVTPLTHVAQMRVTRRIRALVKSKGTFVRPILLSVEEPIRAAAHDGSTVALPLADSLSRLLAHAVAQFYGFMHRSERRGGDYFVHVQPPQPVIVPKRRLCDLIASS